MVLWDIDHTLIETRGVGGEGIEPRNGLRGPYARALARQYEQHADDFRERGRALPGALDALTAVAELPGVVQTVLTGNLRSVAMIKLRVFGLGDFVDVDAGAYGDDADDRPRLVSIAQRRASATYGTTFDRANTVVIGDSPADIDTALTGALP